MATNDGDGPPNHSGFEPIRHTLTVRCDPERAFRLFTEEMGTWWPVDAYSRAVSEFHADGIEVSRLEVQPRLGGMILEHTSDGRVLPWGEITVWDPPHRAVIGWRPHDEPEPPTELEVRFEPVHRGTVVELEHRGWERLSDAFRRGLYEIYVRGWVTTLARYAEATDRMS
jgi:uncharacterized protein YndB with AHSA1/START domain